MIVITKATMKLMDDIYLHDADVSNIICNYPERTVEIPVSLEDVIGAKSSEAVLRFEDVLNMDISFRYPWCGGISIYVVDVSEVPEENHFHINILLVSGDTINVIASKVTYLPSDS